MEIVSVIAVVGVVAIVALVFRMPFRAKVGKGEWLDIQAGEQEDPVEQKKTRKRKRR